MWRMIGMINADMSYKAVGRQLGYHHSVISRLAQKNRQTTAVKDRPMFGRPRVTSARDDRNRLRLVKRLPYARIERSPAPF